MVTAEQKNQIICPNCKYKFSSNNRDDCPKCKIPIEKMEKPTILQYVYYHCTKKKNPNCTQGSIEVKKLERQIDQYLSKIQISERFKNWTIKHLNEENDKEILSREMIFSSQRKAYDSCLKKLDNLFQLKISPLNIDGSLLSDEEYAGQKAELIKEKNRLEEILYNTNSQVEKWLEIEEKTYDFACYARQWFKNGTLTEKAKILQALGSNLILKDKKLLIELKKPFTLIGQVLERVPQARYGFEPKKSSQNERKLEEIYSKNPVVLRGIDKVRTWIMSTKEDFEIPVLITA